MSRINTYPEADSLNRDDFLVIDGATDGTRRIIPTKVGPVDDLNDIDEVVNGVISRNYTKGLNFYVYGTVHNIINDPEACISDYIPVTWGTNKIRFLYTDDSEDSNQYYLWFFTSEKEYITSYVRNSAPAVARLNLSTPENAAYVRISFKKGFSGKLTESSSAPTVIYFSATDTVESPGLVQKVDELSSIKFPIDPTKTTFFHNSKNLIDPTAWVEGEYVNQTNGRFSANSSYSRTDYIPIKQLTSYEILYYGKNTTTDTRYAFYDENKTFIEGALNTINIDGEIISSPINTAYFVMSTSASVVTTYSIMMAETAELTEYEDFDNAYVLPKYIKGSSEEIVLNIPQKIYAIEGVELNIYFENITEKWTNYDWDVSCSKGEQWERGFKFTPSSGDAGTYTLTINAIDRYGTISSKSASLIVTSVSAGSGVSKSIIILGDSTTNNGTVVTKLHENFSNDVMSITTLGTRGTAPNNHEGRSGWKLSDYFTVEYIDYTDGRGHVENPFYNPTTQTFDATYYFANSGVAKPDWFFINMGINDVFSFATDDTVNTRITTCINYISSIITSVLAASMNTKIGLCLTIPPNHSQDAFGKAYDNGQTRNRYKRNNTLWVKKMIEVFDNREQENIYLIPIHTNLDTVYNMGMETLPVNARNTAITYQSPISNGGVHPVESGYWQIADVYTAFLKANV